MGDSELLPTCIENGKQLTLCNSFIRRLYLEHVCGIVLLVLDNHSLVPVQSVRDGVLLCVENSLRGLRGFHHVMFGLGHTISLRSPVNENIKKNLSFVFSVLQLPV